MSILQERSSIVGVASPETAIVRLWPYQPGVYGRDALYQVWRAMEDAGETAKTFWGGALTPETCGDLAWFMKMFDDGAHRLAFVERLEDHVCIGFIWLSDLVVEHQAFLSIWMSQAGRAMAVEAGRQAVAYAFATWHVQQLWGLTPWHRAKALAAQIGFRQVATLPGFCRFPDAVYDVHVLRLTKEEWHALHPEG